MMKTFKMLALFLVSIPLCALSSRAQELVFKNKGQVVQNLSLEGMGKIVQFTTVSVLEPHEQKAVSYTGVPFREILERVYGPKLDQGEEILFTCKDGYQPSIPLQKFMRNTAFLVFRREGSAEFQLENGLQNHETISLAPFYLVWDNLKEPALQKEGASGWPYQIVSVDLIRFADRFPKMAPADNSSAKVKAGFLAFRTNCQSCHSINGEGGAKSVELNFPVSVTEYISDLWLRKWIDNPTSIRFNTTMPRLNPELPNRTQVLDDILSYLHAMAKKKGR